MLHSLTNDHVISKHLIENQVKTISHENCVKQENKLYIFQRKKKTRLHWVFHHKNTLFILRLTTRFFWLYSIGLSLALLQAHINKHLHSVHCGTVHVRIILYFLWEIGNGYS